MSLLLDLLTVKERMPTVCTFEPFIGPSMTQKICSRRSAQSEASNTPQCLAIHFCVRCGVRCGIPTGLCSGSCGFRRFGCPVPARRLPSSGFLRFHPSLHTKGYPSTLRPDHTTRAPEKPFEHRNSEHSLCVRPRRARSKKKGSVLHYPSSFLVLSVKHLLVSLAFPPYRSGPSPLQPTASRRRPP